MNIIAPPKTGKSWLVTDLAASVACGLPWFGFPCEQGKVLILDNPTQGVDVGAKEEIYDIILKLAKEGVSVIVLSSEAQEIIRVCDRALVMYHGEIVGEVSGETMTEHEIMRLATGG